MTKAQIIQRGLALGLDYGLTHSCYDPLPHGRAVRPMRQLRAARAGLRGSGRERSAGGPCRLNACTTPTPTWSSSTPSCATCVAQGDRWKVVARPHRVLPDLGRPAFRYRHARRSRRDRRLRSGRRNDRPPRRSRAREELASARPRRLEPALRSHAAAHRTASAVGGVRARGGRYEPSAFISARRRRRSISTRSCRPIRSPASKKRPTASCGKTAKSASSSSRRPRPQSCRFERSLRAKASSASSRSRTTTCRRAAART